MTGSTSLTTTIARAFLLPGDVACAAIGLQGDDKRELVRMLVNSLVWIVLGMAAAVVLT
jgi:hypothetical protein